MTAAVDAGQLRLAFDFVSGAEMSEHNAYICPDTGNIHWQSALGDIPQEEEVPDDLETSDRYIEVPHKKELGLGRDLVLTFAAQEMPDDLDRVADIFRRRGAYGRFKDLLHRRGMLQRWYDFEENATKQALREWCEDNEIRLLGEL